MAGSIFRQLSGKSTSRRWTGGGGGNSYTYNAAYSCGGGSESFGFEDGSCWSNQMEGLNGMCHGYSENGSGVAKKRVMVVVDQSSWSKHAMMWALTHVTNKADMLTLLHVIPPSEYDSSNAHLATSLGSLCKACKPEVEVEALVIQGPRLSTVLSQVKKLEVSVLVLGQKKPSPIMSCLFGMSSSEGFVEQCINSAECLTIGVRKQSKGMGGYLISTRWQKNFWLLA